jgi:hypothetical protein
MKVSNIRDERLDDHSCDLGAWQNTVKITPLDSFIDGWKGDSDDDWVLTEDITATHLNIVKLTAVDQYPMPLDGTEFTLYYSEVVYSDLSSVNTSDTTEWEVFGPLSPTGYGGATFTGILPGSYVLVETDAPNYYLDNSGSKWYLIYSGGVLRAFGDAELTDEISLGSELSSIEGGKLLTSGLTLFNNRNSDVPLAKIGLIKTDEEGNLLLGATIRVNGLPYFTGAVYGLSKFVDADWDGASYNYGSMLVYGTDFDGDTLLKNWVEIEPGYYELVEIRAPEGYATDPTPIYLRFDGADISYQDNHTNGNNAHLAPVLTLNEKTLIVEAKDSKIEFLLTLQKYLEGTDSLLPGITFELFEGVKENGVMTRTANKLKEFTTDNNGNLTLATLPIAKTGGGIYTYYVLHEALTPDQSAYYEAVPDYTMKLRNDELIISGGPHGYKDIKVVRGLREAEYYVIIDADGAATHVTPESDEYPLDFVVGDITDKIGQIKLALAIPDPKVGGAKVQLGGRKTISGTNPPTSIPDDPIGMKIDEDGILPGDWRWDEDKGWVIIPRESALLLLPKTGW